MRHAATWMLAVLFLLDGSLAFSQSSSTTNSRALTYYLVQIRPGQVIEMHEVGFALIRRVPQFRVGTPSEWWLVFWSPQELSEAIARFGVSAVPLASANSEFAAAGADPLSVGYGCSPEPIADPYTFCAYNLVTDRCPRSILEELNNVPSDYPPLDPLNPVPYAEVLSIGTTPTQGLPIKAVRVGKIGAPTQVPQLLVLGGQHAREWVGVEMAIRIFRYYAQGYRDDLPGFRALLSDRAVVVLPVANPEGYDYTFSPDPNTRMWRKNRNPACDGFLGIDVQRNFNFDWGQPGMSTICSAETYLGPFASSEPETVAIRNLIANFGLPGSFKTAFVVNNHSYGNLTLFTDGFSDGFNICTTTSNCSAADLGALISLAGTELNPMLRDEQSSTPYFVGQSHRGLYAASGTQFADTHHGSLPGGAENAMGVLVELTNTDCNFKAEHLPPIQVDDLYNIYQTYIHHLLQSTPGLADKSWFDSAVGPFTLPHVHRRNPAVEHPQFRVAARKTFPAISIIPISFQPGTTVPDTVLGGVAYRQWQWLNPSEPYLFPHEIEICSDTQVCQVATLDGRIGAGGAFSDLCSMSGFTRNGWSLVPYSGGGPADHCYWTLTASGSRPWRVTKYPVDLGLTHGNRLVYSFWRDDGKVTSARLIVSSNGFVGCSETNYGTCRVVRSYPLAHSIQFAQQDKMFRTEVFDISDFDNQPNVQVRFEVTETTSSVQPLFKVYDIHIAGWRDY